MRSGASVLIESGEVTTRSPPHQYLSLGQVTAALLAMATTGAGTYEERIAKFGVASLEEVAAAAAKPNVVFLDIRSRAP